MIRDREKRRRRGEGEREGGRGQGRKWRRKIPLAGLKWHPHCVRSSPQPLQHTNTHPPSPQCVGGYLEAQMPPADADNVSKEFRRRCEEDSRCKDEIDNYDDGPGEEMANCEFSLAYGEAQGSEGGRGAVTIQCTESMLK